jgi:hypothetical protein
VLDEGWGAVLGGYYSPLYPIAIAPLRAAGVPVELAGRLTAALAGLVALPLLWMIAAGSRATRSRRRPSSSRPSTRPS